MNDGHKPERENKIEASRQGERARLALEIPVERRSNRIEVLILQHPQEPDKALGTAPLCVRALERARLRVGLSWSSLSKAYGGEALPSEWGVLYLGAKGKKYPNPVNVLDKKLEPVFPPPPLKGIVILDGTWSQAKTLWWRNAWLLKLKRIVLQPEKASLYGKLRKEPRKEALSTIESAALCLGALEDKALESHLIDVFQRMLNLYKEGLKSPPAGP